MRVRRALQRGAVSSHLGRPHTTEGCRGRLLSTLRNHEILMRQFATPMSARLAVSLLLAISVAAQASTFQLPPVGTPVNNSNLPFSAGIGHYQQWHSAFSVQGQLTEPARFTQMEFFAGTQQNNLTTTIDLEVRVGHGSISGMTGLFSMNFVDTPVTVFPRANVTLSAANAGQVCLTIPFTSQFTWDGQRALVWDVRVFGNGQGNVLFNYFLQATPIGGFGLSRLYTGGNASAPAGTVQPSQGLMTQFTTRSGTVVNFGGGCPSLNFVEPVAGVSQIAWPGITWNHTLNQAASQRLCVLVMGDSNSQWGANTLPMDLAPLIGAPGCLLLTNPLANFFTTTVGSPGSGFAIMPIQLPPVTSYVGMSLYTQWLVSDPSAVNGVLSASQGIWSIIAPVGG